MKVLIIDDDADIRAIARLSLSRVGGMDVIEAGSGADGVRKAQVEKPDVILLDVMMPRMDGPQTLAALRSRPATSSTPVIFLTAKAAGDQVDRLMSLGAAGVLVKPFDPRTLSRDVRSLIKRRRDRGTSTPASAGETPQQGLDEMRQRFVATFEAECDSIRVLVDKMAGLNRQRPVAALTQITHRLSGLAGTIGFPTVSARASDLEDLAAGASARGEFDASAARDAVDAIRNALAKDLARAPARRATKMAEALPLIRVLLVDDHAMVRRGLKALLSDEFRGAAFGEAADAQQAVDQLRKNAWDVALLDITLPGKSGLDLLKEVKAEWPTLPVLVLSGQKEEHFAVRVLKAGAGGYMTKESAPDELVKAIRKVLAGGRYVSPALAEKLALGVNKDLTRTLHEMLSDREYDVMSRIASGKTVTEIAGELSLSAKTISTYRARVLEKLGVRNSAEIVQYAIRNGLVL
jgi:two-component system, NarL family, invasion response regulator UvrY